MNNLKQIRPGTAQLPQHRNCLPWGDGPWWIEWSAHTLLLPIWSRGRSTTSQLRGYAALRPRRAEHRQSREFDLHLCEDHVFNCPSDPDRLTEVSGHNNYMANSGSAPNCAYGGNADHPPGAVPWPGPFIYSDQRSLQLHGLSFGGSSVDLAGIPTEPVTRRRLASVSRRSGRISRQPPHRSTMASPRHRSPCRPTRFPIIWKVSPSPLPALPEQPARPCERQPGRGQFFGRQYLGTIWASGQPACTRYLHIMPPNTYSCRQGLQIGHVASRRHPGIVNVLFCDGSVKAIKSSVNLGVWWALGTRAGVKSSPATSIERARRSNCTGPVGRSPDLR